MQDELDKQLRILEVERSELSSMKPNRRVYELRGKVLFLSSKEKVLKEKNEEYEKLLKERKVGHDIHLKNKEQH